MKLVKHGVVISDVSRDGRVRVRHEFSDYWIPVDESKTPPRVGSKVVIYFNKDDRLWRLAA